MLIACVPTERDPVRAIRPVLGSGKIAVANPVPAGYYGLFEALLMVAPQPPEGGQDRF
jgi:hypothetical protein